MTPTPMREDPHNWVEDYEHENGNYSNLCVYCRWHFIGHKRRVVCKVCATKAQQLQNLRESLTEFAKRFAGVKEATNTNDGPEVEMFQKSVDGYAAQGQPWCMAFVQYCVRQVDEANGIDVKRDHLYDTESCGLAWAKTPDEAKFQDPQPGRIVIWQKNDGSGKGHTGIVTEVFSGDKFGEFFMTVEGNTSSGTGDQREGDGVYERKRSKAQMGDLICVGFIDPWPHLVLN